MQTLNRVWFAAALAVGTLAYLAVNPLSSTGTSKPACVDAPLLRGSIAARNVGDIVAYGKFVYVATSGLNLLYDPPEGSLSMRLVGNDGGRDMVLRDQTLYVLSSTQLAVYDLTEPEQPTIKTRITGLSNAIRLAVGASLAAVTGPSDEVWLFDASGTCSTPLSTIHLPGPARDVALQDQYLFCAAGTAGLLVYDLSSVQTPELVTTYSPGVRTRACVVDGSHLYVGRLEEMGLEVVDILVPKEPRHVAYVPGVEWIDRFHGSDDLLLAVTPSAFVNLIDISDPSAPAYKGILRGNQYSASAGASSDRVYVASNGVLTAYDRGPDPIAGSVANVLSFSTDLAMQAEYVYAVGYYGGLSVVDLSEPEEPEVVGSYWDGESSWPMDVAVTDDTAYVVRAGRGIELYDVSEPTSPYKVGDYEELLGAGSMLVHDTSAFVGVSNLEIAVLDLSEPRQPRIRSSVPVPVPVGRWLSFDAGYLLAFDGSRVCLIDASDLDALQVLGLFEQPKRVTAVVRFGDYVYAAVANNTLVTLDISDPASPLEVGSLGLPSLPWALMRDDETLYVGIDRFGLLVYDLSNGAEPSLAAMTSCRDIPFGIASYGHYLLVSDYEAGISIIPKPCESPGILAATHTPDLQPFTLTPSGPNPFNAVATFRLDISLSVRLEAFVVDTAGRKVTSLLDGNFATSNLIISWDGRTRDGETAASGVYFLVVESGTERVAKKVTLIK